MAAAAAGPRGPRPTCEDGSRPEPQRVASASDGTPSPDTLARLVQARIIARVPRGERSAFRAADVEALIERGYTLPEGRKTTRRRPTKSNAAPVRRIADLPY